MYIALTDNLIAQESCMLR